MYSAYEAVVTLSDQRPYRHSYIYKWGIKENAGHITVFTSENFFIFYLIFNIDAARRP